MAVETITPLFDSAIVPESDLREVANGMTPVTIGDCFGWFHPGRNGHVPVLLCQPLGREARWTHRTFRKLASRLSAAGLPVLRFDYAGCGDSCDLSAGVDPVGAWLDNVHKAADWLRLQTNAPFLVLTGLRFGAILAANAASARDDVSALVLLAPTSNRTYAQELKTFARMNAFATADDGLELDGLELTETILQAIGKLSLPQHKAPAARVLLLEHGPSPNLSYTETLAKLGVQVTTLPFDGYPALMRITVNNEVPDTELDQVTAWLIASDKMQFTRAAANSQAFCAPRLFPPRCVEQPVTFGAGRRLFGMLCQPDAEATTFVVIIGNSGGDPHSGIGRFAVTLARQLATRGIASFRMDFAGLGDSLLGADDRDGHLYSTDRRADFAGAIDALTSFGFTNFGACGLCTGAYHALSATVADHRITSAALINLATFAWHENDKVSIPLQTQLRSSWSYQKGLLEIDNWRRILCGDVAIRVILAVLGKRALDRAILTAVYAAERIGLGAGAAKRPRTIMRRLSKRGVKILMLLSFEDPGLDALEAHFGQSGKLLNALPGATVIIRDGLDHTLSLQRMRNNAVGVLTDFFAGHSDLSSIRLNNSYSSVDCRDKF